MYKKKEETRVERNIIKMCVYEQEKFIQPQNKNRVFSHSHSISFNIIAEGLRGLRTTTPGSQGQPRSFYKIDWKLNKH